MFKLSQVIIKTPRNQSRLLSIFRFNNFSTSTSTADPKSALVTENEDEHTSKHNVSRKSAVNNSRSHSTMVAAAFASLNSEPAISDIKTPFTDEKIAKATTVNELLSISEGNGVSRIYALKVVSVLANWSTTGKIKLTDFETDPRFVKLCKILTKGAPVLARNKSSVTTRSEDLSTILSVTADDEAAKLVGSITLPQMVKVMSALSQKKRRSTLLLRALAYNITRNTERLNLKLCADLLYSMSTLNFPDENLVTRIANDICLDLEEEVKKSAVIGSIITSMGLLKYKNEGLLEALSEWVLKNHSICRPQDIFSLFMSLAVLNYQPSNSEKLFKELVPQMTQSEAGKPSVWLDVVWSLVLLNQATKEQISSILEEGFLGQLRDKPLTNSSKLKLLNIDASAKYLIKGYNGPRLSQDSEIRKTSILQSQTKTEMVDAILDSLKNLIRSDSHLRTRINTGLGYLIDAECLLDKKSSPLPLDQFKSNTEATRVAVLALDYPDMTRGKVEPTGVSEFAMNLLRAQGYKVLTVPYTEFKPRDKLVRRVQYLESKLKGILKS